MEIQDEPVIAQLRSSFLDDRRVLDPLLLRASERAEAEPAGLEVADRPLQALTGPLQVAQGGITAAGQGVAVRVDQRGVLQLVQHLERFGRLVLVVEGGRPVVEGSHEPRLLPRLPEAGDGFVKLPLLHEFAPLCGQRDRLFCAGRVCHSSGPPGGGFA